MDRERKSGWLLGVMGAILVATIAFGSIYMNWTAERFVTESEQRDCDTLRADILAIESAGQLTEAGARVTSARRARYAQIGCEPALQPATYQVVPTQPRPSR